MSAAGWSNEGGGRYAVQLGNWALAQEPLAAAMIAAIGPWMPYFTSFELSSPEALERVHDEPVLSAGRERFQAWLGEEISDWAGVA